MQRCHVLRAGCDAYVSFRHTSSSFKGDTPARMTLTEAEIRAINLIEVLG